jgi:hypothetical protein
LDNCRCGDVYNWRVMKKYKWYYWDVFNELWLDNGEGVKNWREQGFVVKRLPL